MFLLSSVSQPARLVGAVEIFGVLLLEMEKLFQSEKNGEIFPVKNFFNLHQVSTKQLMGVLKFAEKMLQRNPGW